jgi:hypothetical protein
MQLRRGDDNKVGTFFVDQLFYDFQPQYRGLNGTISKIE